VKVNKLITELPYIKDIFIHPNPGDGGTAIGAALELFHELTDETAVTYLQDVNLGMQYSDEDTGRILEQFGNHIEYEKSNGNISGYVASQLEKGKVIGWFQGREEWGPRALGRRSVLADPRKPETRDIINHRMKNREWFMPFAPSCLLEKGREYFLSFRETPFMTLAFDVVPGKEKDIGAAMHVDNTARVQSVSRDHNPLYYSVIEKFSEKTGVPVILNTSFNRHGLPIVHSPEDAVEHLLWGCVHELAIGSFVVRRNGVKESDNSYRNTVSRIARQT
jgi:carbamoyltransferase